MEALIFDIAPIEVLIEYSNYSGIFSEKNTAELLENSKINEHAIKLEKSKQLLFRSIYSLEPMKLEILKTYIKINLLSGFIYLSKFFAVALILFDKNLNGSYHLCMDYLDLNNLIIKN